MRGQGRVAYDLTMSNPTRAAIEYDWGAIKSALCHASFERYAPDSLGDLTSRQQLVAHLAQTPPFEDGFYDSSVGAEGQASSTMLTASTSEAYAYLFKLLCEAGDSVLVPTPSYPLVERLAAYENVRTIPYRLAYDGAWHLDRESVREAMTERPRAVVVVSPNNPTGSCVSPEELEFLAEFGVPLVVDQVFAPYVLRPGFAVPGRVKNRETLTFVLDGLSKRCGLPQLKLGWISVIGRDHDVENAMTSLAHLADTYLSVNRPIEAALGEILRLTTGVRKRIRQRVVRNLNVLSSKARGTCLTPLHYQGGWSVILGLPRYHSDDDWALQLLDGGVLVQPGWLYDVPLSSTVVLSLLTETDAFDAGIDVVCDRVT